MATMAFGVFLFLHGLIHVGWVAPKPADPSYPFVTSSSQLMPLIPEKVLGPLAVVLVTLIVVSFTLSALGMFGVPVLSQIWRLPATIGAVLSLVMCLVFWHPWLAVGPVLDAAILAAVVTGWPKIG
ncbi:MAG: hypothetical protein CVT66_08495 [Actinobacteria bacterium HGW-Actinobacteria-6]|nr:MAG: hypothetical protein CVT66_08495 [Actinobacteria bacterium HGW-Actinobacteria-6]